MIHIKQLLLIMEKLNPNNTYKLRSRCLPLPTIPSPLPSKTLSMEVWQHSLCFHPACCPPLGLKLQGSKSARIFPCPGLKKGFESRVESTLQKSMLVPVNYDEPVKQVGHNLQSQVVPSSFLRLITFFFAQAPSLSPSQKTKYTILNPEPPASNGGGGGGREGEGRAGSAAASTTTTKLDQVPEPKIVLYRRDQVLNKTVKSCQNL